MISDHIGTGIISAVNLQEVVKALLRSGVPMHAARDMMDALHLDVRPHGREDAFAAAALYQATERFGSGLGDRSCMALAIAEGLPALTADKEWSRIDLLGLKILFAR